MFGAKEAQREPKNTMYRTYTTDRTARPHTPRDGASAEQR